MTGRPHRGTYTLVYGDERRARTVERSLAREVAPLADDRSRARLDRDGRTLRVEIEATDLVALRAATNTWLSLAGVAERVATAGDAQSGDF